MDFIGSQKTFCWGAEFKWYKIFVPVDRVAFFEKFEIPNKEFA
jgi:hypothetical protein